ncbi:MAG TPA: ATP-dependent DNA helicase RecG, partial [Gammaproteobacteria bacterium]|nr:ATP-dependent DNA helicase RecG [Gammaproteobacteria bacterium]
MKLPEKIIDLDLLSCQQLTGVGKSIAERLARLGIYHVQDILFHLPRCYQDRTHIYAIRDLIAGEHVVIEGEILSITTPKVGKTRLLCQLCDLTGRVSLRFFYMNATQRKAFQAGIRLRCFGEVRRGAAGLEMIHPEYRVVSDGVLMPIEENLTPIYPTTEGLNQRMWRKLTNQALQLLEKGGVLRDVLPFSILETLKLPTLKEALQFVHRPPIDAPLTLLLEKKHLAQKRLVFEELLAHRLSLLHLKKTFQVQRGIALKKCEEMKKQFLQLLPFQLTAAQKKVTEEIYYDLSQSHPMLRLVQGDVGSGKTIVAALAILQAVENHYQASVLAPTELLVEQHYQNFKKWLTPLNINVVMLTGQMKADARRQALAAIAEGKAQVILGTHAIFQKDVIFSKLALIIVDEQHRFGVHQRALLREKGMTETVCPHQLIMTATPIPRTLAMSVYADLDYSIIDELPPCRTPITTSVISNTRRDEVLTKIREACSAGRQAYWVCTLIEESDVLQCQAAEKTADELNHLFPDLKIALLHGRMKSVDKEQVMAAFQRGEIYLLVATTVIEVGVDVPNASLMVIENAERL